MHIPSDPSVSTASETEFKYGKKYAYYVLFLLSFLMLFDFIDRMVVSSMSRDLKIAFSLNDAQFGSLVGIVHIAIAVLVFPSAILIDRWSRKKMVGAMALIWGFASLGCAFAPSFAVLIFLRFMVGMGEAGYMPGASTILEDAFPKSKHNTVLGLFQACGPLGMVIGIMLGGMIADKWGWQHAFGIVAIPGIVVAFLAFFLKEPPRVVVTRTDATGAEKKASLMVILKKLMSTRSLVFIYFAMAMSLVFSSCFLTWLPAYFIRSAGMTQKQAGMIAAGVTLMSGIGAALGGVVADKFAKRSNAAPLICAGVYMVLNSVIFICAFTIVPPKFFMPSIIAGALFLTSMGAPAMASVMAACHRGVRATGVGLMILVQNIFGMAIGAGLSGFLSDFYRGMFMQGKLGVMPDLTEKFAGISTAFGALPHATVSDMVSYTGQVLGVVLGPGQLVGLKYAFITLSFTPLLGAFCFFMAARFFKKDCANAECFG